MKKIYTYLLLCSTITASKAQWNNHTSQNLLVANANSSDIQTANTNDGRTWIAFYSQRGSNYDMRAQLLDFNGHRLLGDSGILVSNLKSGSATFVFNVCVDHDNSFIVAFQFQKGSGYESVIQKIDTDGKLLWGNGIDLGAGLAPYPVTLSTNEIAVAWNNNNKVDFQKLSASGIPAWSPYKEFSGNNGHAVSRAQVIANTNGRFSMVYQEQFAAPFYTNLYEQQYNNDGNILWGQSVKISTLTTVTYRYYDVHADDDTTYVAYYGNPSGKNRFDAYVQRINPDGGLPWGKNGSAFSDYSADSDPSEQTIYMAKKNHSDLIWAVCTVTNSLQTASGIYAQKFDALTGARYLGNFAKAVSPISTKLISLAFSKLSLCGGEPIFLATDNSNKLAAVKLNSNGNLDWSNRFEVVGSSSNSKFRYGFTDVYNDQAAAVWQEDKGNGDMPYAQNIKCDGTIGLSEPVAKTNQIFNAITIKNIYPNPAKSVLSATINSAIQTNIHIYITDVSGNVLKQLSQDMIAGNNSIQLNVSNLHAGTYFIKIVSNRSNAALLFQKQ